MFKKTVRASVRLKLGCRDEAAPWVDTRGTLAVKPSLLCSSPLPTQQATGRKAALALQVLHRAALWWGVQRSDTARRPLREGVGGGCGS